ncbi:hypothetical protein DYB32_005761 [Aphanomyces invadans]|uniref:RNA 3'-terminal phosphate cyclase domain-containing protein n=1 Tax=Aphanomyces invadans TaxID=157072 RepID=A0A3R7A7T0_9STRA|nr:hypothetical protein DYB32_005761 [Aphanomyces invadans]
MDCLSNKSNVTSRPLVRDGHRGHQLLFRRVKVAAMMKVVNPSKGSESAGNAATFSSSGGTLKFKGCAHFRQRLICATLSGRRIRIDNIRGDSEEPGISEFEANFLRLLDSITNGSQIEINETGTVLKYAPGFIVGGTIDHDCGTKRSIGWFLEALVALAPFAKRPLVATLKGITNDDVDASVDYFKAVTIPLLKVRSASKS